MRFGFPLLWLRCVAVPLHRCCSTLGLQVDPVRWEHLSMRSGSKSGRGRLQEEVECKMYQIRGTMGLSAVTMVYNHYDMENVWLNLAHGT